jgi:sugar phosphate isomerase/epimerase
MLLSLTTDYAADTGCPEPYLRRIAEAGFTHVHWCHQWNTDFLYSDPEIAQIGRWLDEFGLRMLDLHASDGKEKRWASTREYERLAGVELVGNRLGMAARLGADAIVMHIPGPREVQAEPAAWDQLRRSLDALHPLAEARGVRVAIENSEDNFAEIRALFDAYPPGYLGLCYDCGHGNLTPPSQAKPVGLDALETLKERLAVVHLHDNDGLKDQHWLPFTGSVDWPRLAGILARSAYRKPVSMESNMHRHDLRDEREFLRRAAEGGARLTEMIAGEGAAA